MQLSGMGQTLKMERPRRTRRRNNGMALTAGVARQPAQDQFSRTLSPLRAALRVWETKHGHRPNTSPWKRRPTPMAE